MVSFKGKPMKIGGIRILDENAAPMNAKDFKIHSGSGRIGAGDPLKKLGTSCSMAAGTQNYRNGGKGKASGMESTLGKCDNSVKVRTSRKALADVSNLNNDQKYTRRNQLGNNPKIIRSNSGNSPYKPRISLAKTIVVANASGRPMRENVKSSAKKIGKFPVATSMRRKPPPEINSSHGHQTNKSRDMSNLIVRGHETSQLHDNSRLTKNRGVKLLRPRLSFNTQKALDGNPSFRKPVGTKASGIQINSKMKKSSHVKNISSVERSLSTKLCENKGTEPSSSSFGENGPIVSRGCDAEKLQCDDSRCSNNSTVTLVISQSRRNRRKSYTSSLVARSEILGVGANFIKKDELPIIDDQTNPLEVVEYIDDIYQYYWSLEVQNPLPANYMAVQSDITPKMRGILTNWLIEVHHKFQLMQETLYLMVEILDRALSVLPVKKNELQMVGLTALLLASKYEDYWHPKINELISISANLYTRGQVLDMEKLILRKLRFRLNMPTPYVFMLRFLKAAQSDTKLEHLSFYLTELCLVEYEALKHRPSLLCASAIYVARCTLQLTPSWTALLRKHARYEESQLRACAEMILGFQRAARQKSTKMTYEKFLAADRNHVASIAALSALPPVYD